MLSRAALLLLLVFSGAARADRAATAPRAAFFGSSTVAGVGASEPGRRWTALVSARLGWTEVNLGLGGSTLATVPERTVRSAQARWRADLLAARPDVVVVQYGANDAMLGVAVGSRDARGTFHHAAHEVLLGIRAELPRAKLVVVEFQPSAATAGSRAAYDAALADAAGAAGAVLVRCADAFPADAHAFDSVHLNDAGHAAFAEHVARALAGLEVAPQGEGPAAETAPAGVPALGYGDAP